VEDKKDYLVRTLSRTKRKDYENYVINRIYNMLNDLDIKPMTQKYVKRNISNKHGYCLIDLYFPQFNIGIECDELHHISQEEIDKLRNEDIIAKLGNYNEQRITIYDKTIIQINDAIDKIVAIIKLNKKEQINNGIFKKWEILTPQEYFSDKNKITIFDDIVFSTINEASNLILGTNYKGQQQAWFPIKTIQNKQMMAWFPKLAVEKEGTMVACSNGWNNTLNDSKDIIIEYNEFKQDLNNDFDRRDRVTFMKMWDDVNNRIGYKFLGVFLPIDKIDGKVIHKRISTEFNIIAK